MKGLPEDRALLGHWDTAQFYLVGEANKTFGGQEALTVPKAPPDVTESG